MPHFQAPTHAVIPAKAGTHAFLLADLAPTAVPTPRHACGGRNDDEGGREIFQMSLPWKKNAALDYLKILLIVMN
jgi:hypothetical protein